MMAKHDSKTSFSVKPWSPILILAVSLLTGCQLIDNRADDDQTKDTEKQSANSQTSSRTTLAQLARDNRYLVKTRGNDSTGAKEAIINESRAQRSTKLRAIYQTMLAMEPSENVRAQMKYRLAELNTEYFEQQILPAENSRQLANVDFELDRLITSYQQLLADYPTRAENEQILYQLAKAFELKGELDNSLTVNQTLLDQFPATRHRAELLFRQAEHYYNLQDYSAALALYQKVLDAPENQNYQLNSRYMSGWALFKANRLTEANQMFIQVLARLVATSLTRIGQEQVVAANQQGTDLASETLATDKPTSDILAFEMLEKAQQSLARDTQRILTISLSQQVQAKSLVTLLDDYYRQHSVASELAGLASIEHVLFQGLARFLQEKQLEYDAEKAYLAYIERRPKNIWASRFQLALIDLANQRGDYPKVRELQQSFVNNYGLNSEFWADISLEDRVSVLPKLLDFSYQHGRRLYAAAQDIVQGLTQDKAQASNENNQQSNQPSQRQLAFAEAARWLAQYLASAAYVTELSAIDVNVKKLLAERDLYQDRYLFADASYEAGDYQAALTNYQRLAYSLEPQNSLEQVKSPEHLKIKRESAYATTLVIRDLLAQTQQKSEKANGFVALENQRNQLDRQFIDSYPSDERAHVLASKAAQDAFERKDYEVVFYYSDFLLTAHGINQADALAKINPRANFTNRTEQLSSAALKQVQIANELIANSHYQQGAYQQAEQSYWLALSYLPRKHQNAANKRVEIKELIASSIYQQGEALKSTQPLQAVEQWLRLTKLMPKSRYRINAQFDAANLLLAAKKWQAANEVLLSFQQSFPKHEYSDSIPAKLANSYQALGQFNEAAKQLTVMQKATKDQALKRELQYEIADNYLKAGDLAQAIIQFRTYAHSYPEPFAIAQEVRFKMSEFYRQTKEPNKRYFWYRKLLSFHRKQADKQSVKVQARSTYLASLSALELGQAHQQSFARVKLKLPLNKSLKQKQKSLKQALNYYQQVFDLALADFVPQANYQIANMYQQLASDVLQSQLPKGLDELAQEEYKILLEELAYPFEEQAITLHQTNAERAWQGLYGDWIAKSFAALAKLEPAKYDKTEQREAIIYELF
ncbi:tetratricopeptide repeat protein [Endozoicomonas sp. G2_1]|uniref:tetratricopeptide repeat protein n=1 Tax=Endozoicomonas sp. G2_1 TaxID=2821091 RepID=UPI001ADCDE93|nr:tetratricopeptide repeat protein [Endozoicomonas sp. G2_1]MBO9488843.1 tetratricopeptide repeat protein [Endozoicomonas sp. G2_1]